MMRKAVRLFSWICTHFLRSIRVENVERIPNSGGVILCGNHISLLDVFLLFAHVKRPMRFMGKAELFEIPVISWFIRKCGAFPVKRETGDLTAIRTSINILNSGGALTIFQTGKRNATEAKNGAVYLALKSKVPIVPFSIEGNFRLFTRTTIRFGELISLEEYYATKISGEALDQISESVWNTICGMVKQNEKLGTNC